MAREMQEVNRQICSVQAFGDRDLSICCHLLDNHMKTFTRAVVVLTAVISWGHATAAVINGGFETGTFAGWSTIGDASVVSASFGNVPPQGAFQALITNAPSMPPPIQNPANSASFSGSNAVGEFALETFLGVPSHALAALVGPFGFTFEGSAIMQTVALETGALFTFTWNYLTDEALGPTAPAIPPGDPGFLVLDGNAVLLSAATLALSPSPSIFLAETGYQSTTIFLTPGTHTLGFGVTDGALDPGVNSALLIDNISIVAVSEPSSLTLIGSIVFSLALLRRRGTRK
jgi:hypothetical protein